MLSSTIQMLRWNEKRKNKDMTQSDYLEIYNDTRFGGKWVRSE